jgi:hypothetical protein
MKNKQQSMLPISASGIMLLDELLDEAVPGIPTSISFTKQGIQVRRGWEGNKQKIIERLKDAIGRLEKEEGANVPV